MPLNQCSLPSLLLDPRGGIVQCSAAATALLAANTDVLARVGGRLVVLPAAGWIDSQLAALAGTGRNSWLAALAVPRPGRLPLTLLLRPYTAALGAGPTVLASMCDPHAEAIDIDVLRALFGLTEAEARVAVGLAEGLSTDEIASRRGIKRSSVQSQIKRLLAKTGMARQAALASLMWRTVAVRAAAQAPPVPPPHLGGTLPPGPQRCPNGQ